MVSKYHIMSSANTGSFTSSFPILMNFISLPCLTAVSRTSNTVLNSDKNGHPHLVSALRGKAESFSPLSMMLVVGL